MIEPVGLYNTCTCSFGALEGHKVKATLNRRVCVISPPGCLRTEERISIFSLLADIWVREGMIQELCARYGRRVNRDREVYDSSRQRHGNFSPYHARIEILNNDLRFMRMVTCGN